MVNQIIINPQLELFLNESQNDIYLLIGLSSVTTIIILDKIPILNENFEKMNLEDFEQNKLGKFLPFSVDEIGCKNIGGIKFIGFVITTENQKTENQLKSNFEMKIKNNLNFFKKNSEFLQDEIILLLKSKTDLQAMSINYISQISSPIYSIKFKDVNEFVSKVNLKLNKKFFLEEDKKSVENIINESDLNSETILDKFITHISTYLQKSDFCVDDKILDKTKNFNFEKDTKIQILDNPSHLGVFFENGEKIKMLDLNIDLCAFYAKNAAFKSVLENLIEDLKRTLFCRTELDSSHDNDVYKDDEFFLMKRVYLEINNIFVSVYLNRNVDLNDCVTELFAKEAKNIKFFFQDSIDFKISDFENNVDFEIGENRKKLLTVKKIQNIKKKAEVITTIVNNGESINEDKNNISEKKDFFKNEENVEKVEKVKKEVPPFYLVIFILVIAFIIKKIYFDK
jgi:hypothetical protein